MTAKIQSGVDASLCRRTPTFSDRLLKPGVNKRERGHCSALFRNKRHSPDCIQARLKYHVEGCCANCKESGSFPKLPLALVERTIHEITRINTNLLFFVRFRGSYSNSRSRVRNF